jgi:RNA polymerase sigma-70 factor (ECF subfamily)
VYGSLLMKKHNELGRRGRLRRADELREERFRDLVQRQSRFVFRIAYAMLRNVQDAEDVVQEVFLKLFRNGAWEDMRDERAFLSRTAWRISVDRLPERSGRFSHEDTEEEQVCERPNPEQIVVHADAVMLVHKLMDAMPEELRQPLALSAGDEMSSKEIAAAMGIPEGTVRTRLMRGREILREKLAAVLDGRYAK